MHETLILNLYGIGCKNNCVFCGKVKNVKKSVANKIAREQLKKLDYLKENKNIKEIIISGNDPIEYHDLVGFLKKIKKVTDIDVFFQSHCIDFENLNFLKDVLDMGVIKSIQVPLYGHSAKIHDSITQNPGSFNSVLKALRNFKKLNFNNIQLQTLILKQNEDYIFELFSFLSKFGYRIQVSLPAIPSIQGQYPERKLKNIPDLNKISPIFKEIMKFVEGLDKIFLIDIPYCVIPFNLNRTFSTNLGCRAHKGYDHFKDKVDTVIDHGEIIPTYRILAKEESCKNCIFDKECFGITKPYIDLGFFKPNPFF